MYNYNLAKEIYGVWLCDPQTAMLLRSSWDFAKNNTSASSYPEDQKSNLSGLISGSSFVAQDVSRDTPVPRGTIAQYNLDGPITKGGGMSHYGTAEIAKQFREAEANENIASHLLYVSSGGGSVVAVDYLAEAFGERTKPMGVYIEDVCASAALWLSSYADFIVCRSEKDIVGSIGSMIEFDGYKANTEDSNGVRHIRVYATPSVHKNEGFEKALNDFDFSELQSEMLDRSCADFISVMEANRPNITDDQKTGKVFRAGECLGTLVDEIGSYEYVVEKLTNINLKAMSEINNLADLKANQPDIYAQAIAIGKAEQHAEALSLIEAGEGAPNAVLAQIKAGAGIDASFVKNVGAEKVALATAGATQKNVMLENAKAGLIDVEAATRKADETVSAEKAELDMIEKINAQLLGK